MLILDLLIVRIILMQLYIKIYFVNRTDTFVELIEYYDAITNYLWVTSRTLLSIICYHQNNSLCIFLFAYYYLESECSE